MAQMYGGESQYLIKKRKRYLVLAIVIIVGFLAFSIFATIFNFINRSLVFITYPLAAIMFFGYFWYKKTLITTGNQAESYHKGIKGERIVRHILCKLPVTFTVFQDIKINTNQGNTDFVVVGQKCTCAIEVKYIKGRITYQNGDLLRDGKRISTKNILTQTMQEATNLHDYLLEQSGCNIFVHPVLVFAHPNTYLTFGFNPVDNVHVIQARWLEKLIIKLEKESITPLDHPSLIQVLTKICQHQGLNILTQ